MFGIETGKLVVNLDTRSVDVDGQRLDVTGNEYSILELLSLRKGTTVTRETLLDHLCDSTDDSEIKIIAAIVAKLRKKIATVTGGPVYIDGMGPRLRFERSRPAREKVAGVVVVDAGRDVFANWTPRRTGFLE